MMRRVFLLVTLTLGIAYLATGQGASIIPDPPPIGALPDPTAALAYLGAANDATTKAGVWTGWANDAIKTLGTHVSSVESQLAPMETDVSNLDSQLTSLVSMTSSLQGQVNNLAALPQNGVAPFAVPTGYVIPIIGVQMKGSCLMTTVNAVKGCTGWTSIQNGGLYGQVVLLGGTSGEVGSYYDYRVDIPQSGTYSARINTAVTTGSGIITGHYECPVGTIVGSWSYNNNGSLAFAVVNSSVTLPQGSQTFRFVTDALPPGNKTAQFNWIYLAKQ